MMEEYDVTVTLRVDADVELVFLCMRNKRLNDETTELTTSCANLTRTEERKLHPNVKTLSFKSILERSV